MGTLAAFCAALEIFGRCAGEQICGAFRPMQKGFSDTPPRIARRCASKQSGALVLGKNATYEFVYGFPRCSPKPP